MSISPTLFDDQRAKQARERKELRAEVSTRISDEISQLDLPPKLEANLEARAADLVRVALNPSGTRDIEAARFGIVDSRLLDLIAAKDPSERMDYAKAMVDPREADSPMNFVHGSVRNSFIEKERESLSRIEESILKIQDGSCASPHDAKNLERLFRQKDGKERSVESHQNAVRSTQSSLYQHLKSNHVERSYQETLVSLPSSGAQTLLSAMKEYGRDSENVATSAKEFIDSQNSRISNLDKQHRQEYHNELAALTISGSLANPEVGGAYRQRIIESARQLEANGNNSQILSDATAKYDPAKKIVANSSIYIMGVEEFRHHEKSVEKGNLLGIPDMSSYLVAKFNESPLSETKQVHRAGEGRTEEQERVRGGFLILAKKFKSEGNEVALKELLSMGEKDPKISMALKSTDLKNLGASDSKAQTFVSLERTPVQIFEDSYAKFKERNSGMSTAEQDAIAIRNLQSKNYSMDYLENVANKALESGNFKLARIVQASMNRENQTA